MRERPILFSGDMVRAVLAGTKTQTRRICKPAENLSYVVAVQDPNEQPPGQRPPYVTPGWFGDEDGEVLFFSPYGAPGDRLWVRETWAFNPDHPGQYARAIYRADPECKYDAERWTPSIHMPRAASRILLEVTAVRVERLQDISEADALAEGIERDSDGWKSYAGGSCVAFPTTSYASLWEQINGPGSWDANPWVWVIEFQRIQS